MIFPQGAFVCIFSLRFPLFLHMGTPRLGALICDFSLRFPFSSPKRAPSKFRVIYIFPLGALLSLFSLRFPLFLRFGAPRLGALICDFSLHFPFNSPKRAPSEFRVRGPAV